MHPFLLHKQIDLVDLEHFKLLMFKDDNLYNLTIPPERKNRSLRDHYKSVERSGYPPAPVTPGNLDQISEARFCLHLALAHLWRQEIPTTVLDIGAFVGDFSIQMGSLARSFGVPCQVHAFDPTEAGALIPYNVSLNGLDEVVQHWALAISDYDGYMLFNVSPGMSDAAHTENKGGLQLNVRALLAQFLRTRVKGNYLTKVRKFLRKQRDYNLLVRGTRIADWLSEQRIETSLFCKVDIEGMDRVVIDNLRSALGARHLVCIFEFCPSNFSSPQEATEWLRTLAAEYRLFDVWYSPRPAFCSQVEPDRLPAFVKEIARDRAFGYTDVLMVPRSLPGSADLASRLDSLSHGPREYLF